MATRALRRGRARLAVFSLAAAACSKDAPAPERDEAAAPSGELAAPSGATPNEDAAVEPAAPPHRQSDPAALAVVEAMERARFEADLKSIARERNRDREAWQEVQELCATRFAEAGFRVERQPFAWSGGEGINVVGFRPGQEPEAAPILIGAHYDHIDGCAGADDNASGTAALLEVARVLGPAETRRGIMVACWDEEEEGLLGSKAHAEALAASGRLPAMALVMDAIAFADPTPHSQSLPPGVDLLFAREVAAVAARDFRGDFIGLLYDAPAREAGRWFAHYAEALELPVMPVELPSEVRLIPATAELRRSDHASFWRHEVPAMLVNDTANFRTRTYHCWDAPDAFETLDLDFAWRVTRAMAASATSLALAP